MLNQFQENELDVLIFKRYSAGFGTETLLITLFGKIHLGEQFFID